MDHGWHPGGITPRALGRRGARLWMRIDPWGQSEMFECDKSLIVKRTSIPPRDLRVLGPLFSNCYSTILVREKAIIVNLEFVKAIVTSEEVLIPDPIRWEVLPFVDQLRRQLLPRIRIPCDNVRSPSFLANHSLSNSGSFQEDQQLPFEFRVLEIALEIVCSHLDSKVSDLERDALPALDQLTRTISVNNLEHVRSLKSSLTRLLARVQKVRDEIEHLLDDDEDMAQLYLTRRKWVQDDQQLVEALSNNDDDDDNDDVVVVPVSAQPQHLIISPTSTTNHPNDDRDVDDLEMLLEAYFHQLDATRNKILSVREYIDDTEDYVNIRLDGQRNELIQLQLMIAIASFTIAAENLATGLLCMNFPSPLARLHGIFGQVVGCMTAAAVVLFLLLLGYARWKNLIGSS